ncbi:MAG: AraC family transcriptional regulator [Clostridia bacterium]|nr:AraC family transcriptional regulator [Clostridia bacterium]
MNREELIKEVHKLITENIAERYTIEDLSRRFLINTSSLKEGFKEIYGKPIATYMKEYRMKRAEELLLETEDSMAVIAESVGYESQGKFTAAFREHSGMLPREYRKKAKD